QRTISNSSETPPAVVPTVDLLHHRPNSDLASMPGSYISRQQSLGCLGSPRPGGINRQILPGFGLPVFDDRIDNRPGIVNPIRTGKECLITLHGIMEQPFIGTGRAFDPKRQIIAEMHGHRAQTDVWAWLFGQKSMHNAF